MSDESDQRSAVDRLEALKAELSRHFGKPTRWRALCQEQGAESVENKVRLAEEVLAARSTGTNAEWLTYHLRLKGGKSFDVDEMLAGGAAPRKDGA